MRHIFIGLLGWLAAFGVLLWRVTLRLRVVDDPRPALKASGRPYVYAILHAQQLSFVFLSDDVPIAAMVSASKDGDILVPPCRVRRIIPVRGSTRKKGKDKGGRRALDKLVDHVKAGIPALLAVDGPRGPRGTVHWGVVNLARAADACIVVAGVFPSSRFLLKRSWDRTQLARPFATLTGRFRPIIDPQDFPDDAALREHIGAELHALEMEFDPEEAAYTVGVPEAA